MPLHLTLKIIRPTKVLEHITGTKSLGHAQLTRKDGDLEEIRLPHHRAKQREPSS